VNQKRKGLEARACLREATARATTTAKSRAANALQGGVRQPMRHITVADFFPELAK